MKIVKLPVENEDIKDYNRNDEYISIFSPGPGSHGTPVLNGVKGGWGGGAVKNRKFCASVVTAH